MYAKLLHLTYRNSCQVKYANKKTLIVKKIKN